MLGRIGGEGQQLGAGFLEQRRGGREALIEPGCASEVTSCTPERLSPTKPRS